MISTLNGSRSFRQFDDHYRLEMAEEEIQQQRRPSRKSISDDKPLVGKKKTKAELEQEAYMAQQYKIVIGELKAAEARNR